MPYPQEGTLRCNSCDELIPEDSHGPTKNKKVYIASCPHCKYVKVRPVAGKRFEVITEGDTVEAFWEIFPKEYINQVDEFEIGRATLLQGADQIPEVETQGDESDITELIIG